MNDSITRELNARIEAFAAEITAILQRAVADSIQHALKPATTRASSAPAPGARASAARPRISGDELLRELKKKGGRRIEELSKDLGVPTKVIKGPLKALVAAKKVKTTGQARGTRYRAA